jgi:hypothetical protein
MREFQVCLGKMMKNEANPKIEFNRWHFSSTPTPRNVGEDLIGQNEICAPEFQTFVVDVEAIFQKVS